MIDDQIQNQILYMKRSPRSSNSQKDFYIKAILFGLHSLEKISVSEKAFMEYISRYVTILYSLSCYISLQECNKQN